jgi:shikimate dehydrogenase
MKPISGHTMPFAVLGHPIGHSLSPVMHNASIVSLGLDAIYLAFDVHPDQLMSVLPAMQKMGFKGVNLTVPLKEVAFKGIDDLDESARMLGAVNTVEFRPDGSMRGHNTDGAGFLTAIRESFGTGIKGMDVFVLGTGGAGRAVAITCAKAGAESVMLADADATRTKKAAAEIQSIAPTCRVAVCHDNLIDSSRAAGLVIQATPVGMKPQDMPLLSSEAFREGQLVYDLIYMYPQTALMKEAASAGAKCANGLNMLLHQGAVAFKIWTSVDPDIKAMRTALENSVYSQSPRH